MVLTSSSVILMEEAQPFLFTRGEISRPFCYVGSRKTPVLPSVSFSNINKDFCGPTEISQCPDPAAFDIPGVPAAARLEMVAREMKGLWECLRLNTAARPVRP